MILSINNNIMLFAVGDDRFLPSKYPLKCRPYFLSAVCSMATEASLDLQQAQALVLFSRGLSACIPLIEFIIGQYNHL